MPGPYINNYDGLNPLGIKPHGQRASALMSPVAKRRTKGALAFFRHDPGKSQGSQNYFLMIGDWGRADSPGQCQRAVADHL